MVNKNDNESSRSAEKAMEGKYEDTDNVYLKESDTQQIRRKHPLLLDTLVRLQKHYKRPVTLLRALQKINKLAKNDCRCAAFYAPDPSESDYKSYKNYMQSHCKRS